MTKLLDHKDMDESQLKTARSYAKLLSELGPSMNCLLKKNGLGEMQIYSFAFKKRTTSKEPYPTGIGVSARGIWVAKSYVK